MAGPSPVPSPAAGPTPPPPPSAPPPTAANQNGSQVQGAERSIRENMTSGWFNPITHGDVQATASTLHGLSPQDANKVVRDLAADGTLKTFAEQVNDGSWLGLGGMSADEKRDFFNDMAGKLDGTSLKALSDSFAKSDPALKGHDDLQALGDAIATHASSQTKVDYVRAQAASTTDSPQVASGYANRETLFGDPEAASVSRVIASLKNDPAGASQALKALSPDQLHAVVDASVNRREVDATQAQSTLIVADPSTFKGVMAAAAATRDPALKAAVFDQAGQVMRGQPANSPLLHVINPDHDKYAAAMADRMTTLLKSDPTGIVNQLSSHKATLDGSSFATYAKTMMSEGRNADLSDVMQQLQAGAGRNENPANRFEHTQDVRLPNGQTVKRYDDAEALGYFVGGVQAAAQSITSDQKAQGDLVTNVLKSGLTLLDKFKVGGLPGQIGASLAKEWVSTGVNAALSELSKDRSAYAKAMDLAAVPTDPHGGQIAVGSDSRSAYNTALDTVVRNAKP